MTHDNQESPFSSRTVVGLGRMPTLFWVQGLRPGGALRDWELRAPMETVSCFTQWAGWVAGPGWDRERHVAARERMVKSGSAKTTRKDKISYDGQ
jgi:hypothetical protein